MKGIGTSVDHKVDDTPGHDDLLDCNCRDMVVAAVEACCEQNGISPKNQQTVAYPQMMRGANFSSGVGVHKEKSGHIKSLPEDILLDILSRLPVESVSECKLVCKMWLKLLHGRRSFFTKMHVTRQLNQLYGSAAHDDKLDMGLLFGCTTDETWHGSLFYGGLYNDKMDTDNMYEYKQTLKKVRHPTMHFELPHEYIVNSCHGLVCVGRYHHRCVDPVYIYNPATGEYLNLPKFTIPSTNEYKVPFIARGFGYVPSTHEYKVVRIFYPGLETTGQVQVYTLGSGCGWRTKSKPFPWVNAFPPAAFVDGSLYWFHFTKIYAFDLASEELRILPSAPCHIQGAILYDNFGLVVLSGNLCFFHQKLTAQHMEIWSLKKTGINLSWCKDFNIVFEKQGDRDDYSFWPVMITKNNKIIFTKEYETMECYDPETTTWKEIVADDPSFHLDNIKVVTHVNTFVSLKTLGEKSNKRSCRIKMVGQPNLVSLA